VARRPHVLLLVLDAARRDAVAPYAPAAPTPAMAGLARRGVAVRDAYATAPWTLPSHVAMFTGALASEFGLDQAPGGDPRGVAGAVAPLADRLLASRLAAAGYATHGYSANLWISPHTGLDAGFASFRYVPSARLERAFGARSDTGGDSGARRRRAALAWAREGLAARGDDGAARIGAELAAAIHAADPATPQFWFVNLVEAHSPYLPPRPFNDLGPHQRIRAALDCERALNFAAICVAAAGGPIPSAPALARLAHLHRCAVAYMDVWLAGVLSALAATGMLDDTLVVVTSDHGEAFGEAGLLAHGFNLIPPLVHVPLIAAGPGAEQFADRPGARSQRELPGLIGAAAGLEPGAFGPPGDGIALSRAAAICPADDPRMVAFAARWSLSPAQVARLTADRWSATDGSRTLALSDGALVPGATGPGDAPELLAALEQAVHGGGPGALEQAVHGGGPGALEPPATQQRAQAPTESSALPATADADADADAVAELERQMKLLGYM
jgi:hypothetical protein